MSSCRSQCGEARYDFNMSSTERIPPPSAGVSSMSRIVRGKVKINVSDPTRTILDLLDTPALGGGIRSVLDMLKSYLASSHCDRQLLIRYADQLGNKAVFKRLG